jgi:hypothetical protein
LANSNYRTLKERNKMKKRIDKNLFRLDYNVVLKRIDNATGEILDVETIHNTIVNTGLNLVRDFLGDVSVNAPKYIAIGETATAVQNTDTTLGSEAERELASIDVVTDYQVEFSKTFTFGSGVSYAIEEVGLFDSATASGSTMWNRAIASSTKNVDSDTDLDVTVTITVARS